MSVTDNKIALTATELVVDVVQLLGKIGVFTTTLMTATIGLMVTGVGAIVSIFSMILSITSWLDSLDDLKKCRDTSYGMYRRIRSLVEFTNPNEICYKQFSTVVNWTKNTLLAFKQIMLQKQQDVIMTKKPFVPAEFNSFILYQNILSWLDLNQAIQTAQNGAYNDYIEFTENGGIICFAQNAEANFREKIFMITTEHSIHVVQSVAPCFRKIWIIAPNAEYQ